MELLAIASPDTCTHEKIEQQLFFPVVSKVKVEARWNDQNSSVRNSAVFVDFQDESLCQTFQFQFLQLNFPDMNR